MKRVASLFLVLAVATACADEPIAPDQASVRRVVSAVREASAEGRPIPGEWVIQFQQGAPNARGLMQGLLRAHGGTLKSEHLDIAGAFVAKVPDAAANAIRQSPHVRTVTQNVTATAMSTQWNVPSWGLRRIDQQMRPVNTSFSYPADGDGTHIYFIDTGADWQHEEFGTRMSADVSTVGDNIGTLDGCPHGTQVASVAGGMTHGPAKRARLHTVKVMDRFCIGDVSSYLYGIEWIRANHVKPAVVNASVAFNSIVPAVDSAVATLISTGVSFVVAAGKSGTHACYASPARVPEALTVASTDSFDIRAGDSAIGSCVDLYAPGVDIHTAWYDYTNYPNDHNDWAIVSGTSVAAPFVAGVAASYLQRNPTASPATVHAHIVNTATPGIVQYPGLETPNRLLYQAPTSTISISLFGASVVQPNTTCGWEAMPSGGVGAYFYTWYKNGALVQQGANALYTTSLTSNATISVTVQDAYGSSSSASRNVTVSSSAKRCFY